MRLTLWMTAGCVLWLGILARPAGAAEQPPTNDDREAAASVELSFFGVPVARGNSANATIEDGEYAPCGETHSVWYQFVPLETRNISVQAYSGEIRVRAYVFEGAASDPVNPYQFRCEPTEPPRGDANHGVGQRFTGGQTYLIQVSSASGAGGAYELQVFPTD